MLILSRSEGDGISFPELDLAIQVLRVQGGRVQIGVKAAKDIRILRSELLDRAKGTPKSDSPSELPVARDRFNALQIALRTAQKHLERGDIANAELAMKQFTERLQSQGAVVSALNQASGESCEDSLLTAP